MYKAISKFRETLHDIARVIGDYITSDLNYLVMDGDSVKAHLLLLKVDLCSWVLNKLLRFIFLIDRNTGTGFNKRK